MGDVEKIKKISRIASTWWSDVIENAKMDNGDTTDSGAMAMLLLKLHTPKVTPEQQKQFKQELYEKIIDTIKDYEDNNIMWLDVDYGPNKYLSEPAEKCGINLLSFPIKTTMQVTIHSVRVKYGYTSEYETLYADKFYWENKIKDCKETIKYYKSKDDSYFECWTSVSKEGCIREQKNMIKYYENLLNSCEE